MIVTFDTEKPEDLAALVAIARGAVAKESDMKLTLAHIASIPDRAQRRAALAEFNRRPK
jgi:hypothetical protein